MKYMVEWDVKFEFNNTSQFWEWKAVGHPMLSENQWSVGPDIIVNGGESGELSPDKAKTIEIANRLLAAEATKYNELRIAAEQNQPFEMRIVNR